MLRMTMLFVWLALAIGCAKEPVPRSTDQPVRGSPDTFVPYEDFLAQNNASTSHLRIGMTRDQVVALMKSNTTQVRDGPLSNPYRTESFQRDADIYEVLYYLTRKHPPFTPIRDWQATPVVLKNGTVVGWGQSALPAQRK
jgi:Protein of unknown function (DUF3192)